jgi:hypothetical protein
MIVIGAVSSVVTNVAVRNIGGNDGGMKIILIRLRRVIKKGV